MSSTIKLPEDFQRLDLPEELGRAILDLGFESCTPVQNQVLPHSLDGKDIIAQAQTGTGKTAAFLLSIITYDLENPSIDERPDGTPYALVIAPTRELVIQITNDAESLTKYTDLNVVSLVGGMDYDRQRSKLNKRVDVVVATPGRLLDFAREKAPEMNFCDLNALIRDAAQLIEQPARFDDVTVEMNLEPDLPVIWIDEDLVKQVVMNMLVNAQHAIGERGRITLKTAVCPEPVLLTEGAEAVEAVEVSVSDTGCGISAEDMARIFDPFFTTKEVGKGTGLGLSVSHGAILAHGGDIRVESELGQGTTFHIYLPLGNEG